MNGGRLGWALALVAAAACGDAEDEAPTPRAATSSGATLAPRSTEPAGKPASSGTALSPAVKVEADLPPVGPQVLHAKTKDGEDAKIEIDAPAGWELVIPPSEPDPHEGKFTLAQALQGVRGEGALVARIQTSMGDLHCELFEKEAPITVANFIGLARGTRKFWDAEAKAWVARSYYAGTSFYRMSPGAIIQGGDHTRSGRGRIGYTIPQEPTPGLKFDRPGRLGMTQQPGKRSASQFFIIESPGAHLDGHHTLFGQCEPIRLVQRIARVPQSGPPYFVAVQPVPVKAIEVQRVPGGLAAVMPKDAAAGVPVPGLVPPGTAVEVGESPAR